MARGLARALVLLAKHQVSSLVSTAVDFAVMIAAFELFHGGVFENGAAS